MEDLRTLQHSFCVLVHSSEVFFLLNNLTPDFRTIADFRKDNADAIKGVFREFVSLCNKAGLYKRELIAIDGTKVRAWNASDKTYNKDILERKLERIEAHIEEYMAAMSKNDITGEDGDDDEEVDRRLSDDNVKEMLRDLNLRREKYIGYLNHLETTGDTQILETDSEAHRMHTRNGFHCCYNVQAATDAGSHLICEYEVRSQTNDMGLLTSVALGARNNLGLATLEVVADKGYDSRKDILNTVMNGIIPVVAKRNSDTHRLFNMEYNPQDISERVSKSTNPEDIKKCLESGVLPKCFENSGVSIEVQHISQVGCFTRISEKEVLCPMNKTLRKTQRRRGNQTIFRSCAACSECKNRCTSGKNAKEVCFVDGAKYVAVRMYGKTSKYLNVLPDDYVPHYNSRTLMLKRAECKVVMHVKCDEEKVHTRMCTAEHPFGSIKWYGDAGYLLCKGKRKVTAEIGLAFLAYNIKRAINMLGTDKLLEVIGG
jgi:transposase